MTTPGVPASPGFPPLEHAAQAALHAAQQRLDAFTGRRPAFPMPREEREEALKDAAQTACLFCSSFHPGASTPACPRLATFELNGDGKVVKGSFWPDGATESAIETDGEGKVRAITHHRSSSWDTSRVVAVADMAEDEPEGEDGGTHPG